MYRTECIVAVDPSRYLLASVKYLQKIGIYTRDRH